jgi:hypothetical protein
VSLRLQDLHHILELVVVFGVIEFKQIFHF